MSVTVTVTVTVIVTVCVRVSVFCLVVFVSLCLCLVSRAFVYVCLDSLFSDNQQAQSRDIGIRERTNDTRDETVTGNESSGGTPTKPGKFFSSLFFSLL